MRSAGRPIDTRISEVTAQKWRHIQVPGSCPEPGAPPTGQWNITHVRESNRPFGSESGTKTLGDGTPLRSPDIDIERFPTKWLLEPFVNARRLLDTDTTISSTRNGTAREYSLEYRAMKLPHCASLSFRLLTNCQPPGQFGGIQSFRPPLIRSAKIFAKV